MRKRKIVTTVVGGFVNGGDQRHEIREIISVLEEGFKSCDKVAATLAANKENLKHHRGFKVLERVKERLKHD